MAQGPGTISMPMPTLLIRVKLPRAYGVRMRITAWLIRVAGVISPHDILIDLEEPARPGGGGSISSDLSLPDRRAQQKLPHAD